MMCDEVSGGKTEDSYERGLFPVHRKPRLQLRRQQSRKEQQYTPRHSDGETDIDSQNTVIC